MNSVIDRLRVQGNRVPPAQDRDDLSSQGHRKDGKSTSIELSFAKRQVTRLDKPQSFNHNSNSISGPAWGIEHLNRVHTFNEVPPARETFVSFYGATTIGGHSVLKGKAGPSYLALMDRHHVVRQQQLQEHHHQQQQQLAGSQGATGFELAGFQVTPVGSDVMKSVENTSPPAPSSSPRQGRSRTKDIQRLLKSGHSANYRARPVPCTQDCDDLLTCLLVLPSPPPGRTATAPAPNSAIPTLGLGRSPTSTRGSNRRSAVNAAVPPVRKSAPPHLFGSSRHKPARRRISNSDGTMATPASSAAAAAGPRPATMAGRGSSSPGKERGHPGALPKEVKGKEPPRYLFDSLASYVQFNNLYPALKKLRSSDLVMSDNEAQVQGQGVNDSSADQPYSLLKGLALTSRNGGALQQAPGHLARFPIHSSDSVRMLRQLLFSEMTQPGPVKGVALGPPPTPTSPSSTYAGGAFSHRAGLENPGRNGLDQGQVYDYHKQAQTNILTHIEDQAQPLHQQQLHQQREQHHHHHHHHQEQQHQEQHHQQHPTHTSGGDKFPAIITISLTPKVKGLDSQAHDEEGDDLDDDDLDGDLTAGDADHEDARTARVSTVRSQWGEAKDNQAQDRAHTWERREGGSPSKEAKSVGDAAGSLAADKTALETSSLGKKERGMSA